VQKILVAKKPANFFTLHFVKNDFVLDYKYTIFCNTKKMFGPRVREKNLRQI